MSEHSDIQSHVRQYRIVGAALILGTILTVAASYIHFGSHWMNIAVALLIASVKAALVALIFMHLISEKTAIYLVLGFTVFFALGMLGLTLWAGHDVPAILNHVP